MRPGMQTPPSSRTKGLLLDPHGISRSTEYPSSPNVPTTRTTRIPSTEDQHAASTEKNGEVDQRASNRTDQETPGPAKADAKCLPSQRKRRPQRTEEMSKSRINSHSIDINGHHTTASIVASAKSISFYAQRKTFPALLSPPLSLIRGVSLIVIVIKLIMIQSSRDANPSHRLMRMIRSQREKRTKTLQAKQNKKMLLRKNNHVLTKTRR